MPRWHIDGNFFPPFTGSYYKIAITLKGPGTLFYNMPATEREKFDVCLKDSNSPGGRENLADHINKADIYQPEPFVGATFLVGDPMSAAVHSEPPVKSDRIFLSIVPGTSEQIKELKERWEK